MGASVAAFVAASVGDSKAAVQIDLGMGCTELEDRHSFSLISISPNDKSEVLRSSTRSSSSKNGPK